MNNVREHSEYRLSKSELEMLATRYFDCETTEEEERVLRRELLSTHHSSAVIEEAVAVMGLFAMRKKRSYRRIMPVEVWRAVSSAAAVALLITLGLKFSNSGGVQGGDCIAYVNGTEISDRSWVINHVRDELSSVNEASVAVDVSVEEQLLVIRGIIDNE